MNKEEIEELKDFTIDITDIDELALGLEVCSKKSNMVIQEFADTIIKLQQENKQLNQKYLNAVADYETTMAEKEQLKKKLQEFAKKENRSASNFIEYLIEKWERVSKMSRVHLGMKRPIRQFNKSYKRLLELIEHFEEEPITTEVQKEVRIQMLKERFNDCLIQLNNIKNTQIDYLKESGE